MSSPIEMLKQDNQDAQMSTPALKTPIKQDHDHYFHSHQFLTPSAKVAHQSGGDVHSPLLKTPSSGSSRGTPRVATPGSSGSGRMQLQESMTPTFHTTPGGSTKRIVPNPFEGQLLDKLKSKSPMFSPNMFRMTEPGSAEKSPQEFRWSIDQIAILKPAELEEMPIQQDTLNIVKDPAEEARVQEAIDAYFSTGYIVPSPWTEHVRKAILPRTPGGEREMSVTMDNLPPEILPSPAPQQEASCQTVLSLPVDFNLEQALGEHYTYTSSQQQPPASAAAQAANAVALLFAEPEAQADLSTSSLRRKLFFHGDEGTPLSPVSSNKSRVAEVMDMSSPAVSPVRSHTSVLSRQSPLQTPASSHFSSSPIRGLEQTPSVQRCSTAASLIDSPQISPITNSDISIGSVGFGSPMCLPLEATPSSGCPSSRKLGSPGMSPIGQNNGSYMQTSPQDKFTFSRSDSLRRRALIGQTGRHVTPTDLEASPIIAQAIHSDIFSLQDSTPRSFRPQCVDLKGLQEAKCRIDFDLPYNISHNMDISCSKDNLDYDVTQDDGYDEQMPSAFREFRENFDYDGENTTGFLTTVNEGAHSQDTGYQTQNSQSVINEATMSSNLTNQFSNLPTTFEGVSKDISPVDGGFDSRHSLDEMSDFYSRISHSISEATPTGKSERLKGVSHPLSSTMLSPSQLRGKDKPMEQVFEELQQFANKFSNSGFASQNSDVLQPDAAHTLHKSYSVGEFHLGFKDHVSNQGLHASKSNAVLDFRQGDSSRNQEGRVQFDLENKELNWPGNCDVKPSDVQGSQGSFAQLLVAAESMGDMPTVDRVVRPKTLSRSLSDHTGNQMSFDRTENQEEDLFVTQGLYKGRPAHSNPAFTIETLTPTSGGAYMGASNIGKDVNNRETYSQNARAAKLGNERTIKPRLLFVEEHHEYANEADYAIEKDAFLSYSMKQTIKAPLLDTQLSLPARLLYSDPHPPSPSAQLGVENKGQGVTAKRLLARDLFVEDHGRPKRKSPTEMTWCTNKDDETNVGLLRQNDVRNVQSLENDMDCAK